MTMIDLLRDAKARQLAAEERKIQYAVVAGNQILWHSGDRIEFEVSDQGTCADAVGLEDVPGDGLWIWEGRIMYTSSGGYCEPIEFDVEVHGKYRRPSTSEWLFIQRGNNPFTAHELDLSAMPVDEEEA